MVKYDDNTFWWHFLCFSWLHRKEAKDLKTCTDASLSLYFSAFRSNGALYLPVNRICMGSKHERSERRKEPAVAIIHKLAKGCHHRLQIGNFWYNSTPKLLLSWSAHIDGAGQPLSCRQVGADLTWSPVTLPMPWKRWDAGTTRPDRSLRM